MQFVKPILFQEAVQKLGARTLVGSKLNSAEWHDVPVALRERSMFSSTVESLRFLQRGQDTLGDFLTAARDAETGGLKAGSRAEFVKQLQAFAISEGMGPVDPELKGTIQDVTSEARLGLIFDIQTQAAQDYGYWRQGQDPDVLDAFPAQRFIRVMAVKEPREYHQEFEDQVYLKSDPIWIRINEDFGVPWGPWGWGCGHDVEDVERGEAEELGLLKPGEAVKPDTKHFNENLMASTSGMEPELKDWLRQNFGDQVAFDGETVRWNPSQL